MARPQPTIIAAHSEENRVYEVCAADAVYAVLFEGAPIKVRTHNPEVHYQGYKYGKSMFPEAGHAVRLARYLNQVHDTESFTVGIMEVRKQLTPGESR